MIIVSHRRNTSQLLRDTPRHLGVEVDIRSWGDRLIVQHDAFVSGEDFEDWIENYQHALLILNVKEEGLEARLLGLMKARGIEAFFFLDQSFPFLIKTARSGERRCAVRISEFESIETAAALGGVISWIWLDCFSRFPIDGAQAQRLKDLNFKLCVVSPELQGRTDPEEIASIRRLLEKERIAIDAVCTKTPLAWT